MAKLNKKLYIKNKDGTIETISLYTTIDEVKKEQAYRPIMVGNIQAYYPLGDITNKYATKKRVKIGDTIYAALSETSVKEIKLSELPQTYIRDTGKYSLKSNEKVFDVSPQQLDSLVIDDLNVRDLYETFLYMDPSKDYNGVDFCKIPKSYYNFRVYYGTAYPNFNDDLRINTLDLSKLNDYINGHAFYYLFKYNKLVYNPRSDTRTKIGVVLDSNHPYLKLPVNVMPANINNDIEITGNNFSRDDLCDILSDIYANDCNISYADNLDGASNIPRHEYFKFGDDIYKYHSEFNIDRVVYSHINDFLIKYDVSLIGVAPDYSNNSPRNESILSSAISRTFNSYNHEFPLIDKKLTSGTSRASEDTEMQPRNGPFKIKISNEGRPDEIKIKIDFIDVIGTTNTVIIDNPQADIVANRLNKGGNYEYGEDFILRIHISINKYNEYIFIPFNYTFDDGLTNITYKDLTIINSDKVEVLKNISNLYIPNITYSVTLPDVEFAVNESVVISGGAKGFSIDIILNESNDITPNDLFLLYAYWNMLQTTVFKPNSRYIYVSIHLKKYNKILYLDMPAPSSLIYTFDDLPNDDTI